MKDLRRQLGEEHVYIHQMYERWQKATQRTGWMGKESGAYLQSLRSHLLDLDANGVPNETKLIHRMPQGLSS